MIGKSPISRFAYSKSDSIMRRSLLDRSHTHKTTLSAGLLYPILADEVYPGDTYTVDLSSVVRMSTPIHPVMDNCFLDVFFFFVPHRLAWEHWKEFMGESPSDPYINPVEYSVPQFTPYTSSPDVYRRIPFKSMLDYLGMPAGTVVEEFSQLQVREFCLIWNEWFRDQNLQHAIDVYKGDSDLPYAGSMPGQAWDNNNRTNPDSYIVNAARGGDLPPVNKYHDYFTSALTQPQKGEPVPIPLNGFAPVYASSIVDVDPSTSTVNGIKREMDNARYVAENGENANGSPADFANGVMQVYTTPDESNVADIINPANFAADLSLNSSLGAYATISDLRSAFQLQKFLEADNRGGTRYREILKSHFGVTSPDASMQIPEFLGGKRIPLNMSQVLQTSSTDETSPQGNTAAYSLTSDKFSAFTKSFTEHGTCFCVVAVRTNHSYSQGIEKQFLRKNKFDFYFPEFAHISEQPILNKQIYNGSYSDVDFEKANEVFGFQEAFAELRFKPDKISGEFSPMYPQSLDVWHYGDHYTETPTLSSEWIRETRANIDRTLAVNDPDSDQFIADFYFKMKTARIIPIYSIPGLADHF